MTRTGSTLSGLLITLLLVCSGARAALEASVDRHQVALGDTLRLELVTTGDEDLNDIDLAPLKGDFDILQRSTRSSVNIVNGQRTHRRELLVDLTPRREGRLTIPALTVGSSHTRPLLVTVGPAPTLPGGDEQVLFEAEVDRSSVYVQGQLVLTLRVQQSINLDARSVSELELDNAFVKALEQNSFQRTVNGRPWLVHEIRYAIFPEQSGRLTIPAQTFTARESMNRRSLFDRNSGRLVRRTTQPLAVDVLPRPAEFPAGATWLPARDLTLTETWSTPPGQLQTGESATRTLTIRGEGLQGAQLPPSLFAAIPGLKFYPDQPQITELESASGLMGQRIDSAALVPTRAGTYQLPEIRIPWWDTESGTLREAVLPAREISVATAAEHLQPTPLPSPDVADQRVAPGTAAQAASTTELWWWRSIAAFSVLGWMATLAWLWRSRRQSRPATPGVNTLATEPDRYKNLLAACAANDPARAHHLLLDWGRSLYPEAPVTTLEDFVRRAGEPQLATLVAGLNRELYSAGGGDWRGGALADCIRPLRKRLLNRDRQDSDELGLYPA